MMHRVVIASLAISVLALNANAFGETNTLNDAWARTMQEARRLAVISEIRAKLIDQKDIMDRYIRVKFDGKTLQLAGFVQSTNIAAKVEQIARSVAHPEKVETYWEISEAPLDREPYQTYVGEQTSDFAIWAKVKASLAGPDVRPLLKKVTVQAVDVDRGNVRIYLIADEPPSDLALENHIRTIAGVVSCSCRILKAF